MKYAVAVILAIAALLIQQGSTDDMMEKLSGPVKDCFKDINIMAAIQEGMKKKEIPHDVECAIACALREFDLIDEEGNVNKDKIQTILSVVPGVDKLAEPIIDKCINQEGDKCEKVGKFFKCVGKDIVQKALGAMHKGR